MRRIYREKQLSNEEIRKAINTEDGLRAGLTPANNDGIRFIWVRSTYGSDGKIIACEKDRDCSTEEMEILDDLLKGEIVFRLVRIASGGTTWALASTQ